MNRYKCPACGGNQYTSSRRPAPAGAAGKAENEYLFVIYKNCRKSCKGVFDLKIQEEKIRISAVDRCVMCGNPVPEGQQVCGRCKH